MFYVKQKFRRSLIFFYTRLSRSWEDENFHGEKFANISFLSIQLSKKVCVYFEDRELKRLMRKQTKGRSKNIYEILRAETRPRPKRRETK